MAKRKSHETPPLPWRGQRETRNQRLERLDSGVYFPPKGATKKLTTPLLDLFHIALLRFGPPREGVINYMGVIRVGPQTWVNETQEGAVFGAFIQEHGDAKARAGQIYRAWYG